MGTKAYKAERASALDDLIRVSAYEQKLAELKGKPVTQAEVDAKLEAVKLQLFGALPQHFEPENKSTYARPRTRLIRQILVAKESVASQIEAKLKGGADFGTLAKRYSRDTASAGVGGRITITEGSSIPEFEQEAFKLKTHEISPPVKSRYVRHIIEALAAPTDGAVTPLAEVAPQLRASLLQQEKQQVWTRFLADMKKEFAKTLQRS